MRKHFWIVALITSVLIFTGCTSTSPEPGPEPAPVPDAETTATPAWMETELTDVATGKTFRISDFEGTPVLLESFAVWCPTCLRQQREVAIVKEEEGESIVHVSLDTDPNEDEAKVQEHIERYGFDWYFAVAPPEMSQALIDEFGLEVVSAPQAPMVLICEDLSTRLLRRGVKSASDLIAEVDAGCR